VVPGRPCIDSSIPDLVVEAIHGASLSCGVADSSWFLNGSIWKMSPRRSLRRTGRTTALRADLRKSTWSESKSGDVGDDNDEAALLFLPWRRPGFAPFTHRGASSLVREDALPGILAEESLHFLSPAQTCRFFFLTMPAIQLVTWDDSKGRLCWP
jgi:hypothetical protein